MLTLSRCLFILTCSLGPAQVLFQRGIPDNPLRPRIPNFKSKYSILLKTLLKFKLSNSKKKRISRIFFEIFRVMDIPAVIDYVIVQTSRGKSKSDYLKSFTGLIDVNLNSFSDILTQIHQGTIFENAKSEFKSFIASPRDPST